MSLTYKTSHTEILAYCSPKPENIPVTFSLEGATFNRLVDTTSAVGCVSGYSANEAGFPTYKCKPFNLTNGIWELVSGDCVRKSSISVQLSDFSTEAAGGTPPGPSSPMETAVAIIGPCQ